jgi:hypothetical protein
MEVDVWFKGKWMEGKLVWRETASRR